MKHKQQSRRWIAISVAVVMLFGLLINQLDNHKLYQILQAQLIQTGIKLEAKHTSLSWMHLGSIRLDDVSIQADSFDIQAKRLFIDLDLAALLTGKALPQALYIQLADINILRTEEATWLKLLATDSFKLKRIDISQSEIYFAEQHISLEQVNLDIRDIGKNRNPRMEARAHLGDGRIDAHGYLRLKRGEIARGFARLNIHAIPLSFIEHHTTLETLNGSISMHINQDKTWQSFGHISLQEAQVDKVELRGKLTGHATQLLNINSMILSIKDAGSLQLSGACLQENDCQIDLNSNNIKLHSIMALFDKNMGFTSSEKPNTLQDISIQSSWKNGSFSSSGKLSWAALHLRSNHPKETKNIQVNAAKLAFSGLQRHPAGDWQLETIKLYQNKQLAMNIDQASYTSNTSVLPIQFYNTDLWLPIAQYLGPTWLGSNNLDGNGQLTGKVTVQLKENQLNTAHVSLETNDAEISWRDIKKPKGTHLKINGSIQPEHVELSLQLMDTYASITYQPQSWQLKDSTVNFSSLQKAGIQLPKPLQNMHGEIRGNLMHTKGNITHADLTLVDFGTGKQYFSGKIQAKHGKWEAKRLTWYSNKTKAVLSGRNNHFNIVADTLDESSLGFIQQLPIILNGKLSTKLFNLPFAALRNVSARYQTNAKQLSLKHFKGEMFEGSVRAKALTFDSKHDTLNITGAVQLGGVHLSRWYWLQKQLQTPVDGNLYATTNLNISFDQTRQLADWQANGDIVIYNGQWLLNDKSMRADQLSLSLRKKDTLSSKFDIKHGQTQGSGALNIDKVKQLSGYLHWQDNTYHFSKSWPHIRYKLQ